MYQKIRNKFRERPTLFYACSIVASWAGVGSLMNFRTIALNYGAVPAIIWAVFNSLACMDTMLERTIEAQKKYYKKTTLQDLDVEVAKLRAYLRLSHELGFLPMKKYEVWSGMAVEIGKMLGGWLKTIKSQPKT